MKKKYLLLTVAACAVMNIMAQTYYVAGNGSAGNPWCDGLSWNPAGSTMSGSPATKVFNNVPAGVYEFKVTDGTWTNSWGYSNLAPSSVVPGVENGGGNVKFTISGTANITITFDGTQITLASSIGFGQLTINMYSVVGDAGLCGEAWAVSSSAGDMTESGGVWTKVYTGIAEGTYAYKVVGNHNYSAYQFPAGTGNESVDVTCSNATVTIKFIRASETLSAEVNCNAGVDNNAFADVRIGTEKGKVLCSADNFVIYNIMGVNVTQQNGNLNSGVYIVRYNGKSASVLVK
ncbi:MAG: hypothetical protein FWF72_06965 [Paludibacter sp.]|nr:hypothetical protein [Paludibacter sp.]